MAHVYADLIRKGLKTIDDVPPSLREEVLRILEEENYLFKTNGSDE